MYYTENDLSNKDNEHVDNVVQLVCNTAHDKQITCLIFNEQFFSLILSYCWPKIFKYLDDLHDKLSKGKKLIDVVPSTCSDLLDWYKALESDTEAPQNPTCNTGQRKQSTLKNQQCLR